MVKCPSVKLIIGSYVAKMPGHPAKVEETRGREGRCWRGEGFSSNRNLPVPGILDHETDIIFRSKFDASNNVAGARCVDRRARLAGVLPRAAHASLKQRRHDRPKQLVTTPTGLKKVTRWVIERGRLGQYQRARGLLYPPGPLSPAND